GAAALGVDDDPSLVVDEVVRIIGKEWVDARLGNPCRLWIGQRDFLRGLASTAAAARTITIFVIICFVTAGGIKSRQILSNRTGRLLRLRPGDRLIARHPLLLIHVRLDQARIDRECFAADPPSNTRRNASLSRKRACRARQNTE